jgi:hypothetical protein
MSQTKQGKRKDTDEQTTAEKRTKISNEPLKVYYFFFIKRKLNAR